MTTKNRLQEKNITYANTGLFKTGIKNCAGELVLPAQHTNTKSILYNLHSLKQRIAGINLHVVDSGCSAYRNVYHFACACIYLTAARLTTACVIYSYRINSFLCKTYIHFIYERVRECLHFCQRNFFDTCAIRLLRLLRSRLTRTVRLHLSTTM